ncbi:MAG TPA: hypothetical protein VGQ79_07950 [Nitrospiraceae bacterium]|jgi:hypothetical protein|nr:hypothetical protein [Nitrospiraceae bacterium]
MAAEETKAKAGTVDFTGMAKVWKEAYLGGLEAGLRWQGENERVAKSIIKQGLLRSQQWLAFAKDCFDQSLDQVQGQQNGDPFVTLFRRLIQAPYAMAEPVVKTGVGVCQMTLTSYETALAAPSRKYVLEINKIVMDTVIPY